jgi:sialic acid synthase SpsE
MRKVYIVAELSQNHNGEIDIAKELIEDAKLAGCDAVKLNKRDLSHELTDEAYDRPYNNINSFGETYGQHRKFLEFNEEQHRFLKRYTNNRGMDYILSVCDIPSLEFALELDCPLIKIPSKEINNVPLLDAINKTDKKVAFSIGLATRFDIKRAMGILYGHETIMVICTSEYPADLDNVNLDRMYEFPKWRKGFSSHVPDPMLGIAAVAMGAEYIEYHITMDREMKGSDHIVALELDELAYLVASIRDLQIALGSRVILETLPQYLESTKKKLMKEKCEDGVYRIH